MLAQRRSRRRRLRTSVRHATSEFYAAVLVKAAGKRVMMTVKWRAVVPALPFFAHESR
jgi:hypothetical protein